MEEFGYNNRKAAGKFCTHCGSSLDRKDLFCDSCGARQLERPAAATALQKPQTIQEWQTHSSPPASQEQQLDKSIAMPIASIVLLSLTIIIEMLVSIFYRTFTWQIAIGFLTLSGILVSFILHKKNLYFIAGIGVAFLLIIEMIDMVEVISMNHMDNILYYMFEEPQVSMWETFLIPTAHTLIMLGFFLSRTGAGNGLRIAGVVYALVLLIIFQIGDYMRIMEYASRFNRDLETNLKYLFVEISGFASALCLYLSILSVKTGKKQACLVQELPITE